MKIDISNLVELKDFINWHDSINKYSKKREEALWNLKKNRDKFWFIDLDRADIFKANIELAKTYKKDWFDEMIIIWMWWSTLWTKAIFEAIDWEKYKEKIHIIDNIDSETISDVITKVNFSNCVLCYVSKSWDTIETNSLFKILLRTLKSKSYRSNPEEQVLRIVEEWKSDNWFNTIHTPKNVWWRFSVFTSSSIFPLAFYYWKLILWLYRWIRKQKENIFINDPSLNDSLKLAIIHYRFNKYWSEWWNTLVFFSYSDKLKYIWEWYKQLVWESLWKDWKWLTLLNAVWVTDQHSQLQLFNEWPKDKLICFLEVEKRITDFDIPWEKFTLNELLDSEKLWTEMTLKNSNVENFTISITKTISFEELWKLLYMLEFEIAILWEFYNINVFDQPWVEEWKLITKEILNEKYRK